MNAHGDNKASSMTRDEKGRGREEAERDVCIPHEKKKKKRRDSK